VTHQAEEHGQHLRRIHIIIDDEYPKHGPVIIPRSEPWMRLLGRISVGRHLEFASVTSEHPPL
jgi:hypothetical protein